MDRRDLFKTIAGVAAGAGVVGTVQVAEASERTVPALAILECPGVITNDIAERLVAQFENGLDGGPFAGMKVIVLSSGMKLTMLDAQGHVLNRDIGEG